MELESVTADKCRGQVVQLRSTYYRPGCGYAAFPEADQAIVATGCDECGGGVVAAHKQRE
jgi:hypothetical protein